MFWRVLKIGKNNFFLITLFKDICCTFANVKDLSRHIEYLLCEHNSVAIPGIGLFVTEDVPARYYTEENLYIPPVRSVRLDTSKTEDDGKLERCLIQLHHITHSVAKKWIADYIENINHALIETNHMDIGTIGRFTVQDDKIIFEVCEAGVNTPELYGLDSFQMPKLPTITHKNKFNKDATHFTIRLKRTTVHRVMAAAAMLIIAFTIIMPNYGNFNYSEFQAKFISTESITNVLTTAPEPIFANTHNSSNKVDVVNIITEEPIANAETLAIEPQDVKTSETSVAIAEETVTVTVPESQNKIQDNRTESLDVKGYCVVMASAITHSGADHLIKKLSKEGFTNAVKHIDNGMLRVVLTGYHNEESARASLAIVRATDNLYSGSWIKQF